MLTPFPNVRSALPLTALVVLWLSACTTVVIDHGPVACGPETCNGCCSSTGVCLSGKNPFSCGQGGLACVRCNPEESCNSGACVGPLEPVPDSGTSVTCGPENCGGCCKDNQCVDPRSQDALTCGLGGDACTGCGDRETCVYGKCQRVSGCKLVVTHGANSIDFGSILIGTEWSQPVDLFNEGEEDCEIESPVFMTGTETNAFRFTFEVGTSFTLKPREKTRFNVIFSPKREGKYEADKNAFTFVVNDGAPSACARPEPGCRHISLQGTGNATDLTPVWAVLPEDGLDFGDVPVGCRSVARTALVVNAGGQPLRLSNAGVIGAGFTLEDAPREIPPWQTGLIRIRFTPTTSGPMPAGAKLIVTAGQEGRELPLIGRGVLPGPQRFTVVQGKPGDVDLLFVVHTGKGMDSIQAELRAAAPAFVSRLSASAGTFHAGVVNSDITRAAGVLQGSPRIVFPGPDAGAQLGSNLVVGSGGSTSDYALETARLALIPPNATNPGLNGGFLRKDARLGVVVVSNAEGKSGASYQHVLRALYGAKGGGLAGMQRTRLYGLLTSEACTAGSSYHDLFDGCQPSTPGTFGADLDDIADDLLKLQRTFVLPGRIAEQTPVAVEVEGVPIPSTAFESYRSLGEIEFSPGNEPEPGQRVQITWTPECLPD